MGEGTRSRSEHGLDVGQCSCTKDRTAVDANLATRFTRGSSASSSGWSGVRGVNSHQYSWIGRILVQSRSSYTLPVSYQGVRIMLDVQNVRQRIVLAHPAGVSEYLKLYSFGHPPRSSLKSLSISLALH